MSLESDKYKTITKTSEGIFRDKGSKFIAYAYPISQEEEWKSILEQVKGLHPKARHHCWAYRVNPQDDLFRFNDDGEPSGTAGRPIFNCLKSYDLTNLILVVVRYFGGTLLGVPGLINAYKNASIACLENAEIVVKTISSQFVLKFDYPQMNDVMRLVKQNNWEVVKQDFALDCALTLEIRKNDIPKLSELVENMKGVEIQNIK
ncbi:MAG TPA: YigZ family protein [Sphingobacterium sp.]|nr:YigZ family protein [Sphingobacterium sp.]